MVKSNLKRKTINGFFWGLLESVFSQGLGFIFGIFLARLLSPQEFGLLGMITIFISVAQVFVDSGLSQALIRKQNCSNRDYSTVFWANVAIGVLSYLIIWFCSPLIATFYNRPELIELTRVTALAIIIGSLTLIQQTIITKEVDFKTLTKISTVGTVISGLVAIALAFRGFGVWSLVWRSIINQVVRSILLWRYNRWLPLRVFDKQSFKELFGFSSNILFITVIAALFKNVYNLVIGRTYSDKILGYYTNADQYSGIPSNTLSSITNKVSYPVLATLQNDDAKLKASCSKLVNTTMYASFLVMFGFAAMAYPMFAILFGKKWLPAVEFFQVLCIAYAITPMHIINQNILKIKGRSDLFLKTEIIKYIVFVPFIALGIFFGLRVLIAGIAVFYWVSFFINAMYTNRLINYSSLEQTFELLPVLLLTFLPALLVWILGNFLPIGNVYLMLIVQGAIYIGIVWGFTVILRIQAYLEIKQILTQKFSYLTFNNIKKEF